MLGSWDFARYVLVWSHLGTDLERQRCWTSGMRFHESTLLGKKTTSLTSFFFSISGSLLHLHRTVKQQGEPLVEQRHCVLGPLKVWAKQTFIVCKSASLQNRLRKHQAKKPSGHSRLWYSATQGISQTGMVELTLALCLWCWGPPPLLHVEWLGNIWNLFSDSGSGTVCDPQAVLMCTLVWACEYLSNSTTWTKLQID